MRATTGCLPRAYWSGEYRELQVVGQALEETSLCLDGVSGLMHWLGHASFVGVLTDEPMRKFGQRHRKFCQTIYPFEDVFYPTVKEGGEE